MLFDKERKGTQLKITRGITAEVNEKSKLQ